MRRIISLLVIVMAHFMLIYSQEKEKQTEFGLVFSNLNNFGFTIKKGSPKFMWRFNTLILTGNKQPYLADSSTYTNIGFNFSIGHEFKKKVNENFEFCFGYDFSYGYSQWKEESLKKYQKPNTTKITYSTPGFNFVFGFNYIVKEHLVLGAELLPFFNHTKISRYNYRAYSSNEWDLTDEQKSYSYGITNNSARLLIAYRF